jgi:MoaA/NifB/PqqE/SkfB family radical SAM enzyme
MIKQSYKSLFSGSIDISLKTAANILSMYPESARAFADIGRGQKAAQKRRKALATEGIEVPPLTIVSTTDACNLACAGCYACSNRKEPDEALSDERIAELLNEAFGLGVSIVMLAGGEPLLSHSWLEALGAHKEMAGIVFTNGTLMDKSRREWFSRHRHIIPTFSLEGGKEQTDARRGFIHISASGAVEPCPFAPFSDVSIKDTPLREALASRFLSKVRENHHLLKEGEGGCALWHNREWLAEIL